MPLTPAPEAADARRPPIVLGLGRHDPKADTAELRRAEAQAIAALLHGAHRDGWEIRDRRDSENWRRCRWGDMAILMPARTGIELFENALAEAGIPYRHEGARDFFQRQEVRDLVWVLAAIDDPTDRLATVGALRSSAFALNDEDLVMHVAQAGSLSYRSRANGPSPAVNEALTELADLHRLRTKLSLAEAVRRVVERARLVEFALTRPDGDQGAANLLAIVDQARLFAAAGGGGLRPFIRHLRSSMKEAKPEIEATVAEETDDVVRIMTAHGAKGLEFPIVALANLSFADPNHAQPVPREAEHFLHFRIGAASFGRNGYFKTPSYDEAWNQEKEQVAAERRRLLYVAATRAREHLVIPCVIGRLNATGLLATFVAELPEDDRLVMSVDLGELEPTTAQAPAFALVTDEDVVAGVAERELWLGELAPQGDRGAAAKDRDRLEPRSGARPAGGRGRDLRRCADPRPGAADPRRRRRPHGDGARQPPGRRRSAPDRRRRVQEGDIAEQTDDVISMCRACLEAPSLHRALGAPQWWREVPFVLATATAERSESPDRGPLVSGRVDLVYRDGDELVVVDYKTDKDVTKQSAETHALEHHSGQAEVYAKALAAATGLPVREVAFVYCKAGVEVRLREGAAVH